MGRAKSVLVSMAITEAGASHNCKADKGHRITKGVKRLTIKEGQSKLNYCLPCAQKFVALGAARLGALQAELSALLASSS